MKWGELKKVENGGCFFVKKSGPFLNTSVHYVQYQQWRRQEGRGGSFRPIGGRPKIM